MDMESQKEDIHFGHLIKDLLKSEGRSIGWFAKQMHSDRSNMYKLLERTHLNTDFLFKASMLLHHDFFNDASTWLDHNQPSS
jgi:hypothetical protein